LENVLFDDETHDLAADLGGHQVVDPSSNYVWDFVFDLDFTYTEVEFQPGTWLFTLVGNTSIPKPSNNLQEAITLDGDVTINFVNGNNSGTSNGIHWCCNFTVNSGVGIIHFEEATPIFYTATTYSLYVSILGVPTI
jgi:hypothetical protein